MLCFEDFEGEKPAWCPGCGNFAILNMLKRALVELELSSHRLAIVSGLGQNGKLPHYLKCHAFSGLHGRALPLAAGLKLANQGLTVLAVAGDGDGYGHGGNHLIHAIRRDLDLTLLVHNNQIQGLTGGQTSPTSRPGVRTRAQPLGSPGAQLNPLTLAISQDCGFVARAFAGGPGLAPLKEILKQAINHPGFAMVDILQNCVSFNRENTFHWYKERNYPLEAGYDPSDRIQAFARSLEWGDRIPTGIFYRRTQKGPEQGPKPDREPLIHQVFDPEKARRTIAEFY